MKKNSLRKKNENYLNFLHIYYGNGKGKTTAAFGLALRALGADKKIAIVQFDKAIKGNICNSDFIILNKLKSADFKIDLYSTGILRIDKKGKFRFRNIKEDFDEAMRALEISKKLITNGSQDLLILDEILSAVYTGLISKRQVEEIIKIYNEHRKFELILTGFKIWKKIKECADLVTNMKKIKHYFDNGVYARHGIEY